VDLASTKIKSFIWSKKMGLVVFNGLDGTRYELFKHIIDHKKYKDSRGDFCELWKIDNDAMRGDFRQLNIALVNELALITRGIGISVNEVINAAASKPYGFMKFNPSIGVGGHCIPVDPSYLAHTAKSIGVEPRFIELANEVNLQMPREIVKRIKAENGGTLSGKKILVCGVSYKPNVADTRETPTEILIEELGKEGAEIAWHDPLVLNWNQSESVELTEETYDVTIVAVLHDSMNKSKIANSSKYIFDCTGKMSGGHKL
jgi:UDP-N-acetyl-D-glucosamine dehydrogenase